ncbi:hypothetical protein LJC52_05350 [Bacteroidales bacterium OttesenSCG-928-A17]|nr:hypothetical protein [Bacteroidales bacterium OttesenSCG-928-A17]
MKTKIILLILLSTLFAVDNCLSQSAGGDEFENIPYEQEMKIGNDYLQFEYEILVEEIRLDGELRNSRPDIEEDEATGGEIVVPVGNGFFASIIFILIYSLYKRKKIRGRVFE